MVQRAAEELGTQLQAGGAFHNGRHFKQEKKKKEPLESQNNNPWTYWKSFELLLDLTEAFFEVVCGQKLVPVEGFPASERTERRSQSRESPGLLKDSQGGKEVYEKQKRRRTIVCGERYRLPDIKLRVDNIFFIYIILTCAEERRRGISRDKGKKKKKKRGGLHEESR